MGPKLEVTDNYISLIIRLTSDDIPMWLSALERETYFFKSVRLEDLEFSQTSQTHPASEYSFSEPFPAYTFRTCPVCIKLVLASVIENSIPDPTGHSYYVCVVVAPRL